MNGKNETTSNSKKECVAENLRWDFNNVVLGNPASI